jgi:aminoglycoside phosphotransferase (APT) family kinase protein
MMTEPDIPPPVARLDAAALVAELNVAAGTALVLDGPASGGEVGAAYVHWSDGRHAVVTRSGPDLPSVTRAAGLMDQARRHGVPCARYDLVCQLTSGVVIVQERLAGAPPTRIDDGLVADMVALNDRCAGVLADRPDVPGMDLYLTRSGPGFCLHESLERYDDRTRRLLSWVREVGAQSPPVESGTDLVHPDFHPWNVLVDHRHRITGVIDWDAAPRGDRHFALVTLLFDLARGVRFSSRYSGVTAEGMALVKDRIERIPPGARRRYWAHMSLRLVDWSIRHHTSREVDHYLAFCERGMGW